MADPKPNEQPEDKSKIDEYQLLSVIATGKMSQVWEVVHEQSGQKFAMKLLLPEAMKEPDEIELLKHEAKVAQGLDHPNLNRCHGIVSRKTECYLLLDLFKTPNIKQWLHNNVKAVQTRLSRVVEQTCLGLGYMHDKGWVHKDIKPDNILLSRSDEVRLIDFSLAVKKASGLTKLLGAGKGPIRGTRTYLAPETIKKEAATPATDIYSLGIVYYEILTGTVPFKGETPQDLLAKHISAAPTPPSIYNKNVTPEMDALIAKMLAKKPGDRPQTCQDVWVAFSKIQAFKEPVSEIEQPKEGTENSVGDSPQHEEVIKLLQNRLSSKDDAKLQELLRKNPELAKVVQSERARKEADKRKKEEELRLRADREQQRKKGGGAPSSPAPTTVPSTPPAPQVAPTQPSMMAPMPGYMPQPMPLGYGMPQHPMMPYGMPPAGMPMQMPGYAPQPGMQPPMMPGMYPPGTMPPGYSMPPGMPMPAQPGVPGQFAQYPQQTQMPPTNRPAPAQRPGTRTPPRPTPSPQDANLPIATELPDIE